MDADLVYPANLLNLGTKKKMTLFSEKNICLFVFEMKIVSYNYAKKSKCSVLDV